MWMMCGPSDPLRKTNTTTRTSTSSMRKKTCFIGSIALREKTIHVVCSLHRGISRPARLTTLHHVLPDRLVCVRAFKVLGEYVSGMDLFPSFVLGDSRP